MSIAQQGYGLWDRWWPGLTPSEAEAVCCPVCGAQLGWMDDVLLEGREVRGCSLCLRLGMAEAPADGWRWLDVRNGEPAGREGQLMALEAGVWAGGLYWAGNALGQDGRNMDWVGRHERRLA